MERDSSGRQPILQTIRLYLRGPTPPEQDDGYGTALGPKGIQLVKRIEVSHGTVTIDFASDMEQLPNAGPNTASHRLLRELFENVFQYEQVQRLRLTIDGSCARYWELFGYGPVCHELTPDGPLEPRA